MTPTRRSLITKIHVARAALALGEDSYRALLKRLGGAESCADLDDAGLAAVYAEFKRLGFRPVAKSRAKYGEPLVNKAKAGRKLCDGAQARKIRALWICLYQMGAVRNPSEEALALFVKREVGLDDLHWLTAVHADQVIKALRGWMVRLGYVFPTAPLLKEIAKIRSLQRITTPYQPNIIAAKVNVVMWQAHQLDQPQDLAALAILNSEELDQLIEDLGSQIRD